MTARVAFRKADVVRACEAAQEAGLQVARIIVNDNGVEVVIGEPEKRIGKRSLDRLHAA